jgi:UDP:flavonoid glycosyltransferase YjiC (YdhE family)
MDLDKTLRECRALHEKASQVIDQELVFIRDQHIRLIVGDIPPLCFEIAARATIPSIAITNFTWNTIYRAYLKDYPDFAPLILEMEQFYEQATIALALPYSCDMNVFPRQEAIPWIARASPLIKEAARAKFELPASATVVLLSFGGLGLGRFPIEKLKQLREFFFVATGEARKRDENLIVLPDVQRQYEDLVRAVDVVVTKPGYGMVADILAHRVPILYTDRGEFPEYRFLVQALSELATAEFIPQNELLAGNIEPYLKRLLGKAPNWPSVALDGARLAAEKVIALLGH